MGVHLSHWFKVCEEGWSSFWGVFAAAVDEEGLISVRIIKESF